MLPLFVLTVVIGSVFGVKPCCLDRQFEIHMGEIGGVTFNQNGKPTSSILDTNSLVRFDLYHKRMQIDATSLVNGKTMKSNILIDLEKDDMYITAEGHCTRSKNTVRTPFTNVCIPDDAKLVRSSYIGYGVNSINFTTWQYKFDGIGEDIRLSVTDEGCIPIAEAAFGSMNGYKSDIMFIVTNYRPGISDTQALNLPHHCHHTHTAADQPEHLRRVIKAAEQIMAFR